MSNAHIQNSDVHLILSKSEALVLFEWLSRNWEKTAWRDEDLFSDPAEKQLLICIESDLNKILDEQFLVNYNDIIQKSYREIMPEI